MSEIRIIKIGDLEIKALYINDKDYLCISDFVPKEGTAGSGIAIIKWLSQKGTLEFLGLWEKLNNQENFNVSEFGNIKNQAGTNSFSISTKKWVEKTNAIGISSKAGRYNSGTYAHEDIAMEFASWLSPEFKLYLITEFKRLKKDEAQRNNELEEWNNYRWLSKLNYRLHTDSIKHNIILPNNIHQTQQYSYYSTEADILNIAVFGMKASDFKKQCPELDGKDGKNLRDVASKKALSIIANLESSNANMIREGLTQDQRFNKLTIQALEEKKSFNINNIKELYKVSEAPLFYQDLGKLPFFAKMLNPVQELENVLNNPNAEQDLEKFALAKPKKKA